MKVYKFKDLTDVKKHSHFLQIVLNNSIWCARPDSLNDEYEFEFKVDRNPSLRTAQLLLEVLTQHRTRQKYPATIYTTPDELENWVLKNKTLETLVPQMIDNIIRSCRTTIGITSFSTTKDDFHIWEEYGGKGNGVFVEINIPDHLVGQSYHLVRYVSDRILHIDSFLESELFPDRVSETYRDILLTKTRKWAREKEIRFIGNRQDVSLIYDGYISEITFGPLVAQHTLNRLMTAIGIHCSTNNIIITNLKSFT